MDFTPLKPFTENSDYNNQERYAGAEQKFTGLFTTDCDVNKSFKTFFFELVLKCLQTEGEAPPFCCTNLVMMLSTLTSLCL